MEAGGIGNTGIRVSDLLFRLRITQGGNKILGKLIVRHNFFFFCKVEIVMGVMEKFALLQLKNTQELPRWNILFEMDPRILGLDW